MKLTTHFFSVGSDVGNKISIVYRSGVEVEAAVTCELYLKSF